jgi:hypothetical protein
VVTNLRNTPYYYHHFLLGRILPIPEKLPKLKQHRLMVSVVIIAAYQRSERLHSEQEAGQFWEVVVASKQTSQIVQAR